MDFNTRHFARLARISLTPEEDGKFEADIKEILGNVRQLEELDTKDVPPMTGGTNLCNVLRDDEPADGQFIYDLTAQFPEKENGYLKVPEVFSKSEEFATGGEDNEMSTPGEKYGDK